MSVSEIDWEKVNQLSHQGRLSEYFDLLRHDKRESISPSLDDFNDFKGYSLLHFAARKGNMKVLYVLLPLRVYTFSYWYNRSPLHIAATHDNIKAIEAICACQTSLISIADKRGYLPLDDIPFTDHLYGQKILIANGARLKNVKNKTWVTQELRDFERGVLRCRDVIVTLLGLKKRKAILPKLDRFLVQQELAVAIWATRHQV